MEHLDQKVKEHQEVLLKYPKNIRQIGEIGEGKRIYVEDYVMTYAMHLAEMAKEGYASAVLLGQKAVVEGRRTLFISGAVELAQNWQQLSNITGEQWTAVYDQIQLYFHHVEILGWFLTRPGIELDVDGQMRAIWHSGFEGEDRILFLYDNISREEAFYTYKEGEFSRQSGYYIYYEKNEEMQNYIIEKKGGKSTDEGYQDMASKKIRKKIGQKNQEHKKYLFQQQLVYSAGILAGAVVLVAAATKLYGSTSGEAMADLAENEQVVSQNGSWFLPEETGMTGTEEETAGETKNGQKQSEKAAEETIGVKNTPIQGLEATKNVDTEVQTADPAGNADSETQGEESAENTDTEIHGTEPAESTGMETQGPKPGEDTGVQTQEEEGKIEYLEKGDAKKTEQETASSAVLKEKSKVYKVKKGDTLESISIAYYGTSRYIKKIKRINQLENADRIYIGQELILP